MTTLDIQYSREFEIARVKRFVSNFEWYVENKYKISLPDTITNTSTEDEIKTQTENQFNEELYSRFSSELQVEWQKFLTQFEKVKAETSITFNDTYTVVLTRYGTGGSFDASLSEVILRIEGRTAESALGTLVHEMVHIAIHEYIQMYEVGHWKKERLVDLIVEHCFPGLRPMQALREDITMVDTAFKEHFPNVENVTRIIGAKRVAVA
jgi:methyltransferase-like protein